jgi:hypothetical protein
MKIDGKPIKCSNCGSTRNESFSRRDYSGVRCLDCGHEKTNRPEMQGSIVYTHDTTTLNEF